MSPKEHSPHASSSAESLNELAKGLCALYDGQFDADINPANYHADLILPVSPDMGLFESQGLQDYTRIMTGSIIQKGTPWEATVGYVPATDNLGLTRLSLPLQQTGEYLTFQRVQRYGFMPLLRAKGKDTPLSGSGQILDQDSKIIQESFVEDLVYRAGYDLSSFVPDPRHVRNMLAEIMDKADAVRCVETVTLPTDPDILLNVTRTLQKHSDQGTPTTQHGSIINQQDRSESYRRKASYSDFVSTDLTATMEFITRDAIHRKQVIISFAGEGFTVDLPTIQVVDLEQNRIGLPDRTDSEAYEVVRRTEIPCDETVMKKLLDSTLDTLTGR